jgi:hypothetical protein
VVIFFVHIPGSWFCINAVERHRRPHFLSHLLLVIIVDNTEEMATSRPPYAHARIMCACSHL